jgi:hypothetical protein
MTVAARAGRAWVVVLLAAAACGAPQPELREVLVEGRDYAFSLPSILPAGPTVFAFTNRGVVDHELMLAALKPGVTMASALSAARAGRDSREFLESGASVLYASPGQGSTARLLADLQPGRTYAVVCLMRDKEGAPPHTEMGMATSFVVQ